MATGSICGQRGGGGGAVDIRREGGVVQNRESPVFRSPEQGCHLCYCK